MVHIRKVACSCGHVFVAKHIEPLLASSRKHTLHSFRAVETDRKAAERRSVDRKRALETEEEALERGLNIWTDQAITLPIVRAHLRACVCVSVKFLSSFVCCYFYTFRFLYK